MIIIKIILLIILGSILLILFAPFKYSALVLINEEIEANIHLGWVILKVKFSIEEKKPNVKIYIMGKLLRSISPTFKKAQRKDKYEKKKTKMPNKEFFVEMFSLSKGVFKIVKPKEFIAMGTYGAEDPSITGIINLVLIFIAEVMPWAQIDLYPVYEEEVIHAKITTYGSVSLIMLICLMLKYVFKKEVRKVLFYKHKKIETLDKV